jgi:hypothetical protein
MVCALATAMAVLAPPASGDILLLPFTPAGAGRLPRLATIDGMRMIARGPFGGSIVVRGDGYRTAGRMIAAGILPIAAGPSGCVGTA